MNEDFICNSIPISRYQSVPSRNTLVGFLATFNRDMESIRLGAAIVAVLISFFQLEIDWLCRLDQRRFEEERKLGAQNGVPTYDFIIGMHFY